MRFLPENIDFAMIFKLLLKCVIHRRPQKKNGVLIDCLPLLLYRLVFLCAVLYGRIKRSIDMDCYETRRHPSACRLLGAKGSIYAGESRVTRRVSRM